MSRAFNIENAIVNLEKGIPLTASTESACLRASSTVRSTVKEIIRIPNNRP